MITLRCTAKLLKRLHQPAKLPEPPPATNPLGEWYADSRFFQFHISGQLFQPRPIQLFYACNVPVPPLYCADSR